MAKMDLFVKIVNDNKNSLTVNYCQTELHLKCRRGAGSFK